MRDMTVTGTRPGIMRARLVLAAVCTAFPMAVVVAAPPDKVNDVNVTNPVLPVEVQNANPIPVAIASGSGQTLYGHTIGTTCPYLNQCIATFPAVPAGKRLHVKFIAAWVQTNNASYTGLGSLHADNANATTVRLLFPVNAFAAAYYGPAFVFNQQVDVVFESGEAPVLEIGTAGSLNNTSFNKMTVTGVLVDATP